MSNLTQKYTPEEAKVIEAAARFVKSQLKDDPSGHDWWHIHRVWANAIMLSELEGGDRYVVELAALLHDIADWKFSGDDKAGPEAAREWLAQNQVPEPIIAHVAQIIKDLSFKGAGVNTHMKTLEGMIVQDADRLDALGAVGIGRTFAYGGHKGRLMYDPDVKPTMHQSFEEYKKGAGPTINHFYEKLFLLYDRLNTQSARKIGRRRHDFMKEFVDRFEAECNGTA